MNRDVLSIVDDAKKALLNQEHTIIGGDPKKEQFSMRGHLDALELVLNESVQELSYHLSQAQITSAEKETAGAIGHMNVVKLNNDILNDEYRNR